MNKNNSLTPMLLLALVKKNKVLFSSANFLASPLSTSSLSNKSYLFATKAFTIFSGADSLICVNQ